MKKAIMLILLIIVYFCTGCNLEANPIILPNSTEINAINIETLDDSEITYTDSKWVEKFISAISEAQATSKSSVQDFPMADDYGTIDILHSDKHTTLYYYEENGKYYIEQPYQGIYKTKIDINQLIMGVE